MSTNNGALSVRYRADIDGLRAVAVAGVLIYHAGIMNAGWQPAPGGYLGVDVFFVISGYLITSIIRNGLIRGDFSFAIFYKRRIRRIAPPLLMVVLASTPFAWMAMPADMFDQYSGSAFASLALAGNVWFWLEDSYVSPNSALKPLLHLWSLGVEEQFYLLMPITFFLVWRTSRRLWPIFVLAAMVLSFAFAQGAAVSNPDAAFFLLPFRAWELLLGAYIALAPLEGLRRLPSWISRNASNAGLLAIIISFACASHRMLHPAWGTLLPVIGAGLVIAFPNEKSVASKILHYPAMVWLGLVSYSLYLIHYPVMSIMRIEAGVPLSMGKVAAALALSIVLAALSYRLLERPLRNPQLRFAVAITIIASLLFATILSLAAIRSSGYTQHEGATRVHELRNELKRSEFTKLHQASSVVTPFLVEKVKKKSSCRYRHPQHACSFGDAKWVSLGDSYVAHFEPVLHERFEAGGPGFLSLAYEQCPLLDRGYWFGNVAECPVVNELRWQRIEAFKQKKVIVYAANYGYFTVAKSQTDDPIGDGKSRRRDGEQVAHDEVIASHHRSIARLLELGHRVVLIYSVPKPRSEVRLEYLQQLDQHGDKLFELPSRFTTDATAYEQSTRLDQWVDVPDHPRLLKIYPRRVFCEDAPPNRCLLWTGDGPIYNGGGHLSRLGATKIVQSIEEHLSRVDHTY